MVEFLAAPRSIDNFFLTPNPHTSSPQPPPIATVYHLSPPWPRLPKTCAECFIGRCYCDVFQLIKAHQEKPAKLPPIEEVPNEERDVIRTAYFARHSEAFWVDFGDFQFTRIEPKVVRFVSVLLQLC